MSQSQPVYYYVNNMVKESNLGSWRGEVTLGSNMLSLSYSTRKCHYGKMLRRGSLE